MIVSSDIDRVVDIVQEHQLQASISGSEVRHLPWHDWWCHSNGIVVSSSISRPSDIYEDSNFSKMIISFCPTWSSWKMSDT